VKAFEIITDSDRKRALACITSLPLKTPGKPHFEVSVKLYRKQANHEQRKRHWARMAWLSENYWVDGKKYDRETWHEFYKRKLIGVVDMPDGSVRGLPSPDTAKEYAEFDNGIDLVLSDDGVYIPEPRDEGYEQLAARSA